ncbi:MAG: aminodeoxychorismate/anthranilate synthase component II [Saprospiraceae bacterium]|nr:aminodeoxychorismate/anthranilate synthase component II [Saprospiraceae bacterium]
MKKNDKQKKIILLDNYDSFTYNLYDLCLQLGVDCKVIRNDEKDLNFYKNYHFDGLILSPGPKKPENAGIMMALIQHYFEKIPILGVCLGYQAIGEFFGVTLQKAHTPMHGKLSTLTILPFSMFKNFPSQVQVMRYHSLLLTNFEHTQLQITAFSESDEAMAFQHNDLPIWGVQYHPEAVLTEHGKLLINNWLKLIPL